MARDVTRSKRREEKREVFGRSHDYLMWTASDLTLSRSTSLHYMQRSVSLTAARPHPNLHARVMQPITESVATVRDSLQMIWLTIVLLCATNAQSSGRLVVKVLMWWKQDAAAVVFIDDQADLGQMKLVRRGYCSQPHRDVYLCLTTLPSCLNRCRIATVITDLDEETLLDVVLHLRRDRAFLCGTKLEKCSHSFEPAAELDGCGCTGIPRNENEGNKRFQGNPGSLRERHA